MATQIGPYSLELLETGEFALDGGAMFGVVPKNLWSRTNPADKENRIDMNLRIMLIRSKDRVMLVDTGIGDKFSGKYADIYRVDHSKYTLAKALAGANVDPKDVTDVILTHLHFDHAGGTTYREGDELKLMFPNATHTVQKKQWDWALNPTQKDQASFFKENILPLKDGKLKLLDGEEEIYPGIHILISHGHTESQQLVKVTDGQKTVIFCGDLIPTASHLPIPFLMSYDNKPLDIMTEKQRLLDQAVKESWILCFEHDPKIPACTVGKDPKKGRFVLKEKVSI